MKPYERRHGNYLVIIIVFVFFLIIANIFSSNIRGFFYRVTFPAQQVFWGAGQCVSNFFGGIAAIGTSKSEIERLKLENRELSVKLILLKETQEENVALKEALGLELNKKYKLIQVKFVSKNVSDDVVLLNKGINDGIGEGMPIITSGGIIVGRVKETSDTYSKGSLLSAKKFSFDVRIKHNDQDVSAVAEGGGNFNLFLSLIPQEAEILNGDVVVTDTLGGVFPELLAVGRVKNIRKSDVSPFQEAEVEQFFSLSSPSAIFIVAESSK